MADKTKIEWTDATWNIITGCMVVSPGCTNCYAMRLAGTRLKNHESRKGLTIQLKAGPVWNGEVRFNEQWLTQPLNWKKPRRIFVCAHGDLFAEGVQDEWLDQIFAVIALCPQHTFQVLTKRPERMREYMQRQNQNRHHPAMDYAALMAMTGSHNTPALDLRAWPLPNVWLGVSVEDQKRADERIPVLLDTPAALRWISAEPLLGPLDLTRLPCGFFDASGNSLTGFWRWKNGPVRKETPYLDWIVAGGESGPDARPMHPDWARSLRDQCAAAGVPFNFKQWGHYAPADACPDAWPPKSIGQRYDIIHMGTPDDTPGDRLVSMHCVGKKVAGRKLDGEIHDDMPEVQK